MHVWCGHKTNLSFVTWDIAPPSSKGTTVASGGEDRAESCTDRWSCVPSLRQRKYRQQVFALCVSTCCQVNVEWYSHWFSIGRGSDVALCPIKTSMQKFVYAMPAMGESLGSCINLCKDPSDSTVSSLVAHLNARSTWCQNDAHGSARRHLEGYALMHVHKIGFHMDQGCVCYLVHTCPYTDVDV